MTKARTVNWGTGIMIAFGIFGVGLAVMIWIALSSPTDLVADDYYQRGLEYEGRIQSIQRARSTGGPMTVTGAIGRVTIALPEAARHRRGDGDGNAVPPVGPYDGFRRAASPGFGGRDAHRIAPPAAGALDGEGGVGCRGGGLLRRGEARPELKVSAMEIVSGFLVGIMGSVHCAGMCGPIALALPSGGRSGWPLVAGRLMYNVGRIVTYALFGLIVGGIGRGIALLGYQQALSIVLGIFLILTSLAPLGGAPLPPARTRSGRRAGTRVGSARFALPAPIRRRRCSWWEC